MFKLMGTRCCSTISKQHMHEPRPGLGTHHYRWYECYSRLFDLFSVPFAEASHLCSDLVDASLAILAGSLVCNRAIESLILAFNASENAETTFKGWGEFANLRETTEYCTIDIATKDPCFQTCMIIEFIAS